MAKMILTDIHCHMLPGIDDGAADAQESMAMLKKAYRDGVRRIIVTPHYRRGMFEPDPRKVLHRYEKVKEKAAQIGANGIELYLGCECHRYSGMAQDLRKGILPTLAESRYVLVEFSGIDPYSRIRAVIYELTSAGFVPIIAHVERCRCMAEHLDNVQDAIDLGARIQVNAASVLGKHGRQLKRYCKKLMKRKMIDYIASDAHDLKVRPLLLRECADYVEKKWGKDIAKRIFVENPSEIIGKK